MTNRHPLAEDYLRWLEPQIRDEYSNQNRTYWELLNMMMAKDFEWFVPNDDNRIMDGLDLRAEYCFTHHIHPNSLQDLGRGSFLEVLIGLSRRVAFDAGGPPCGWAWQLLQNLELHRMSDPLRRNQKRKVDQVMETVIRRTYAPDGQGGFFPLIDAEEDQTQVELWYQLAAFVLEIHPEYTYDHRRQRRT